MFHCCKAANTISSPMVRANYSTARAKAASTYFFLSGGQIDGQGNVNLVSTGDYAHPKVRFPGSFGSAYLYYVVPKVILFRTEHSRRTLVPKVDFISAPGTSEANVYRSGGPIALVTNRCLFSFANGRFVLTSVHPGHTIDEVVENTGFDFEKPATVPQTPAPSSETLALMREMVAPQLAEVYPQFARRSSVSVRLLSHAEKSRPSGCFTRGLVCRARPAGRATS